MEENIEESGIKKGLLWIWEFIKIAVVAMIIVLPIRYFLFQPFIVKGDSMVPNYHSGDYLIVDEISYRLGQPQRGDVVVFDTNFIPGYAGDRFIKRVIGLPGETVTVKNGEVSVNGNTLKESYLPVNLKTYGDTTLTLKPDEYFVMGDNREFSYDSRAWGYVPRKEIIGKSFLRVLPITNFSLITNPSY